jgi:hypothetical protein
LTTYQCVDGPLAGQTVTRRRVPPLGRPLTVAVVDVEHGVLAVDYRVQHGGPDGSRRWLRFVAARDVRRSRRGLLRLAVP